VLRGHERSVEAAGFSHNGAMVVTASLDKTARLWDVKTGNEKVTYTGHLDRIRSVCFSKDDKRILTLGQDQTVRIWRTDLMNIAKALVTRTLTEVERNRFHAKSTAELMAEQKK